MSAGVIPHLTKLETEALKMLREVGSDSGWIVGGSAKAKRAVLQSLGRKGFAVSRRVSDDKVTASGGYSRGWRTAWQPSSQAAAA